jgi:hypothetical protein
MASELVACLEGLVFMQLLNVADTTRSKEQLYAALKIDVPRPYGAVPSYSDVMVSVVYFEMRSAYRTRPTLDHFVLLMST